MRQTAPDIAPAWKIQVELATRVDTVRLGSTTRPVGETLACLRTVVGETRAALREAELPAASAAPMVRLLPAAIELCALVEPVLDRWEPLLAAHERTRPAGTPPADHETAWGHASACRADLAALSEPLGRIVGRLSEITGADLGLHPPVVAG
ncbi:hypothetical protein HNR23_002214 [Nocardiopsis mwathae]|uniref:Uncharacterized protein n=1 Tax=Nocardiopsis mwathae TaxID=1472723 RepID=A0A7W9YHF8_9ACTN|nr:hypothetical protein [Nocardiopsis mwathae]MBB6172154.1 hypothetical protein [Nocardiopsis mwathae]